MLNEILENLELWNEEQWNPVSATDLYLITEVVVATLDWMETMNDAIKLDESKWLMNG